MHVTRSEDWGKGKDLRAYLNVKGDASDGIDATFVSKTVDESTPRSTRFEYGVLHPLDIKSIISLEKDCYEGTCYGCKKKRVLHWQITNFQDERADVCQDCGMRVQEETRRAG